MDRDKRVQLAVDKNEDTGLAVEDTRYSDTDIPSLLGCKGRRKDVMGTLEAVAVEADRDSKRLGMVESDGDDRWSQLGEKGRSPL